MKMKNRTHRVQLSQRREVQFALSALALAVAGTLPRAVLAETFPGVNSQSSLVSAVTSANGSSDASSTVQLSGSFQLGGPVTLQAATKAITLDTGTFVLTGPIAWSGTFTIGGTGQLVGAATAGGTPTLTINGATVPTAAINNATITGGNFAGGASGAAGTGVTLSAASLVNNGTISGGPGTGTGAGGIGVMVQRGATLTNFGLIKGGDSTGTATGGWGVNWGPLGATLINNGTIQGGSNLSGAVNGAEAITVRTGASPVVNNGTLIGGNGVGAVFGQSGSLDLINSGTLQPGAGAVNAIDLNPGVTLTLEIHAGSVINGNVVGNAGLANAFILGGDANDVFDVSSIGSAAQYRNFNTFTKTGASTWALTGTGTTATPWTIQQGTLQIGNGGTSGSIIGNVTDNGTLAFDRSDTFSFDNLVSGTGSINQVGAGTTIITAANTYSGGTNVLAGTLAVGDAAHTNASIGSGLTTVAAGATLGGYGTVSGSVNNGGTIAAGNALAAFAASNAGAFNIGGDLNNAGIVNLASSTGKAGNVLNVAGNYTGTSGQVVLNTVLNAGGAASQSDRLVVGGNVSGTTAIKVNQSGSGAATIGDGIQLVQVGGASAANSFHLAGPIQAGAFQYMLFQGGATDANDWYLRSQLAQQTTPDTGDSGTTAPPATSAAGTGPIAYRPAVAGYTVTPLLNADYGYAMLGRLHERVGDVASLDAAQPAHSNGVWGRIGGQNVDADAGNRFSADERTFFAEFGKDWTLSHNTSGGSTHAGATVSFGSTSATFADSARSLAGLPDGTGSVETQAQSIGGYWTKYLPDGSYFDGVGQFTHYQNRYGDIFGDSGSQNGFGAGVSGEVGKPFALGSSGVAIEPQAQLLYQYLHLNHFDDGISDISSNTTNGLRGRLGFRIFKANLSNDSKSSTLTPYFTADVLHDFFTPGQTTVGGTSFDNELGKTWYDLGVGMTGSFGKSSEGYANVKYAHNFSGEYRRTVFAQVGYRYSW
jgi:outer membrane autotransporter protein